MRAAPLLVLLALALAPDERPRRSSTLVLALAVVAAGLAGCAKEETPAAKEEKLRLAPTGYRTAFFEKNVNMTTGQRIELGFTSARPITWDVHTHVGEKVEVVAGGREATGHAVVTATHDGVYSLSFLNTLDEPVDLTYTFEGP